MYITDFMIVFLQYFKSRYECLTTMNGAFLRTLCIVLSDLLLIDINVIYVKKTCQFKIHYKDDVMISLH